MTAYGRQLQLLPDPIDVDLERAIIIHLPAGTGQCTLHWVDINAGWEAVQLAAKVRDWRARKGLTEPYISAAEPYSSPVDEVAAAIADATDEAALYRAWDKHQDRWTDEHTAAAAARKAELTA